MSASSLGLSYDPCGFEEFDMSSAQNSERILFVGGILNDENDVEKNTKELQELTSRHIVPFWNSTWPKHKADKRSHEDVSQELASKIGTMIQERRLCIIAHSHGASILLRALEILQTDKNSRVHENLEVYTFGGVTVIPEIYAKKVGNYKNRNDTVSSGGAKLWGEKPNSNARQTILVDNQTSRSPIKAHDFIGGYDRRAAEKIRCFASRNNKVTEELDRSPAQNSLKATPKRGEILFVGGRPNDEKEVQRNALELELQSSREGINPFYNGNWAKHYRRHKNEAVSEKLADEIREKVQDGRLCIIAHGDGAKIVSAALEILQKDKNYPLYRENLEVYTFGGGTVIPEAYAKRVGNYKNETDKKICSLKECKLCHRGSCLWGKKNTSNARQTVLIHPEEKGNEKKGNDFLTDYVDQAAKKVISFCSRDLSHRTSLNNPQIAH